MALLGKHCKVLERPYQFLIQMVLLFDKSLSYCLMSCELQNHLKTEKHIRSTLTPNYLSLIKPRSYLFSRHINNHKRILILVKFGPSFSESYILSLLKDALPYFIINCAKRQKDLVSHFLDKFRPFWALSDPFFLTRWNLICAILMDVFPRKHSEKIRWTNPGKTWVCTN